MSTKKNIWISAGEGELLACPFCEGGKFSILAQRGSLYAVQCHNCGAVGPTGHSRAEAVTLWNEREQLTAATARAEAAVTDRDGLRAAGRALARQNKVLERENQELRQKIAEMEVDLRYSRDHVRE